LTFDILYIQLISKVNVLSSIFNFLENMGGVINLPLGKEIIDIEKPKKKIKERDEKNIQVLLFTINRFINR